MCVCDSMFMLQPAFFLRAAPITYAQIEKRLPSDVDLRMPGFDTGGIVTSKQERQRQLCGYLNAISNDTSQVVEKAEGGGGGGIYRISTAVEVARVHGTMSLIAHTLPMHNIHFENRLP